jgi:predicted TIM-barrel fold metal-dependent hydrolase
MYTSPVIDSDCHHAYSPNELVDYFSQQWRDDYVLASGDGRFGRLFAPAFPSAYPPYGTNKRLDSFPPNGGMPGTDLGTLQRQVLNEAEDYRAVLTYDIGHENGAVNPYFAVEICRAMNDWTVDRWLSGADERIYGSILVPGELPDEAAKEIRRLAKHPRMVQVLMVAGLGKPFGHPLYDPVHEAAAEAGLPISIHSGSDLYTQTMQQAAGGLPQSRFETFVAVPQSGQHSLLSFFQHATFTKFPDLRLLITESGFSWVPSVVWKLDRNYHLLRRENPLVNELPSETLRRHVKFTTQPIDFVDRDAYIALLESFEGMSDLLCYASDYPHWDTDSVSHTASRLPESWHSRVFCDNAVDLYGDRVRSGVLAR